MSMDLGGAQGGVRSEINVTPLVDVMLVLLIIIMLIAPMLEEGVSVKLPIATSAVDKPSQADQTIIAIGANKMMYVNAKQVPEGELANRVRELTDEKTEKIVIIKADQDVEYGVVMAAMDSLRQVGIEDIGLITERPPSEGAK